MTTPEIIALLQSRQGHLGLSNYKLAQLTGLNRSTIARIYSGHISPSLDTIYAMSSAMGLRIAFLDETCGYALENDADKP